MDAENQLRISGNQLRDQDGVLIATLPAELGQDRIRSYASVFAVSCQLLHHMEEEIGRAVGGNEAFEQDATLLGSGYLPYICPTAAIGTSDWITKGIHALAKARGDLASGPTTEQESQAALGTLSVRDNILEDDFGNTVAVISTHLEKGVIRSYAHVFAASVDLLKIIDDKSTKELRDLRNAYEEAQKFNGHQNLPANVTPLQVTPVIIPGELKKARRLVETAKGDARTTDLMD